jgi:hypothetical protein
MENKIKCHFCGGVAIIKYEDITIDDGKITIKNEPYYSCQKCKQEFCTSEQMFALDKRLHEQFTFKRSVIAAGKSLAITLPADIVTHYKIKKGKKVSILAEPRGLKIKFDY